MNAKQRHKERRRREARTVIITHVDREQGVITFGPYRDYKHIVFSSREIAAANAEPQPNFEVVPVAGGSWWTT